jgi:hypothetical protein
LRTRRPGLLNAIQIVDKLQITPIPVPLPGEPPVVVIWPGFVIIAAWLTEAHEIGEEYQLQTRFIMPDGNPVPVGESTFRVGEPDRSKLLYRFLAKFNQPPPLGIPGTVFVESRIRRVGTENWQSQQSPILVEMIQAPPQNPVTQDSNVHR